MGVWPHVGVAVASGQREEGEAQELVLGVAALALETPVAVHEPTVHLPQAPKQKLRSTF